MTFKRKYILACLLASCLSPVLPAKEQTSVATQQFIVKDIQIEGHRRVTLGSVLRSLPIQVGESVNASVIAQAIRALYRSGDFEDVQIFRVGDTLLVRVVERKTISSIDFVGNKDLKKDALLEDLKLKGIAVGEPLNPATLHNLNTYLESIYHSLGKYSATVHINQKTSDKGTVALEFVFVEGQAAKIAQINIIGNESFHESELLDVIELSDFPLSIPLWNKNKYQEQLLRGDLESLRSFYMDRGYLEFQIKSTQVALTPDKKSVYLTIYIDEGQPVRVDQIDMQGNFVGHKAALQALITYKTGEYFSAQKVADTEKAIAKYLGRDGYAYPQVITKPQLKEAGTQADLTIHVTPGNRMSVRRINFFGNEVTDDAVLRREMRQMESAWLSSELIERSKRNLQRLAFIKNVNIDMQRVVGKDDLVDLNIHVEEARAGTINFGVNYSLQSGVGFTIAMQQENFLGTGDSVGINFQWARDSQAINLERYDPYFTVDGIGLGTRLFFKRFEASKDNLVDYTSKSFGAQVSSSLPISEYVDLTFIGSAKREEILQEQEYAQVRDFWERVGNSMVAGAVARFNLFELTTKWSHDTRDSRLLPREGHHTVLSFKAALPFSDLKFWKTSLDNRYYYPLDTDQQWIFYNRSLVAYGNGYGGSGEEDRRLPFFENYFAGGSEFLRGFKENTIGPKALLSHDRAGRSELIATDRSLGGNAIAVNSMNLIFPTPFIPDQWRDQIRTAVFFDVGNVWDTYYDYAALIDQCSANCNYIRDAAKPGHIRASLGVAVQLRTPFGPMSLSLAKPLKQYDGDQTQLFDFSISNSF